jgi:hypothetical protein
VLRGQLRLLRRPEQERPRDRRRRFSCQQHCPIGGAGALDSGCEFGLCDATARVCRDFTTAELCSISAQDNQETDVDCGGAACGGISVLCTGKCDTGNNQCRALTGAELCTSIAKSEEETDVDYGGPICSELGLPCALTEACVLGRDCGTGDRLRQLLRRCQERPRDQRRQRRPGLRQMRQRQGVPGRHRLRLRRPRLRRLHHHGHVTIIIA